MTYREAVRFVTGQGRFGSLGLERIRAVLEALGHPEAAFPWVHLAGTNGKGSTARFLAGLLSVAGPVGLYTSPSLERLTERIMVDGREIPPRRFAAGIREIRTVSANLADPPTEFEYLTALAFYEFRRSRVRVAVVETGLGGRFDATNVGESRLSIITGIGRDHTRQLGETLEAIAGEKAGILRPGRPLVLGRLPEPARVVILAAARDMGSPVYEFGRDFSVSESRLSLEGARFFFQSPALQGEFQIGLPGAHQVENASLALAAWSLLRPEFPGDPSLAAAALARVRHPGRFEVLAGNPLLILDGAHNADGSRALAGAVRELLPGRSLTLLTGLLAEKDPLEVLGPLLPLAERVLVTEPPGERRMPAERLGEVLSSLRPVRVYCRRTDGLRAAIRLTPPDGVVLVAGSLYLVGALRGWLARKGMV